MLVRKHLLNQKILTYEEKYRKQRTVKKDGDLTILLNNDRLTAFDPGQPG